MRFALSALDSSRTAQAGRQNRHAGFSLMEVLLIIALLSATILPFAILMSQTADNARGVYLQSSRSILLNSLTDEATVERNTFVQSYANTMNSTVTESGQVLPFRRQPDAGASDTFQKTIYFYLYNNTTDSPDNPRYKTKLVLNRDTLRVRFDAFQNGWTDASGFFWGCYNGYDAANDVPGTLIYPITIATLSHTIFNLQGHADAVLFENEWYRNGALEYTAPVSNGLYTVKLYFSERNYPTGRLMDIYLEGTLMNPGAPYNASQACGPVKQTAASPNDGSFCANVQMFDVMVTDGSLNIKIDANTAATHLNRQLNAIFIKKRS